MTPDKLLQLSQNLLSGSYTNDVYVKCLQGLLIDDIEFRERIIELMLGIKPNYNKDINTGDMVFVPKGQYFFKNDYDLDKTIDSGYAQPPSDPTYYQGELICEVIGLHPYQKINTFDLKTEAWSLNEDKLIEITFSENWSTPQLIKNGKNK